MEDNLNRARARMKELIADALALERLPLPTTAGEDAAGQDLSLLQDREKRIAVLERELLEQGARFESERGAWERRKAELLRNLEELKSSCAAAAAAQAAEAESWQRRLAELLASGDPHVFQEKAALEKLLDDARAELGARQARLNASESERIQLRDLVQTAKARFADMKASLSRKQALWQRYFQALEAARRMAEAKLERALAEIKTRRGKEAAGARELESLKARLAAESERLEQVSGILRQRLKAEREHLEGVSGEEGLLSTVAALESWLAERPAFIRGVAQLRAQLAAEKKRWAQAGSAVKERFHRWSKRIEELSAELEAERKSKGQTEQKLDRSLAEAEARLREKTALETELQALKADLAAEREGGERDRDALQAQLRETLERLREARKALETECGARKQAEQRLGKALSESESWLAEKASMAYGLQELKARAAAEKKHVEEVNAVLQGRLEAERKRLQEASDAWEREGRARTLAEEKLARALAQAESRLRERSAAACELDAMKAKLEAETRVFEQVTRTLQEQLETERRRLAEISASWEAESKARTLAEEKLHRALTEAENLRREKAAASSELEGIHARLEEERTRSEQARAELERELRERSEQLQEASAARERETAAKELAERKLASALAQAESRMRENAAFACEREDLKNRLAAQMKGREQADRLLESQSLAGRKRFEELTAEVARLKAKLSEEEDP